MSVTLAVCSRCARSLRKCSPACAMGGWVHVHSEKHLCNPSLARLLLCHRGLFSASHFFAHCRMVKIDPV